MKLNDEKMVYVRAMAKSFLNSVEVECNNEYGVVSHPFTISQYAMGDDGEKLDLTKKQDYEKWSKYMERCIDACGLDEIFGELINKPWRLAMFLMIYSHLDNEDFSRLLSSSFTDIERTSSDPRISTSTIIKWFKRADKRVIMNDEEYEYWSNLPDAITLYRGIRRGGIKLGISWTTDIEMARWFQKRFESKEGVGSLYRIIAPKECCLCYFNKRGECEIILDIETIGDTVEELEV